MPTLPHDNLTDEEIHLFNNIGKSGWSYLWTYINSPTKMTKLIAYRNAIS